MEWIPVLVIAVLALVIIVRNIYVVQQSRAYVIERLGAFSNVWTVGIHFKVPFVERVAKKVSLKEQVLDYPPQPVITKDNATMQIDTVVYFQITDPKLYAYGVEAGLGFDVFVAAETVCKGLGLGRVGTAYGEVGQAIESYLFGVAGTSDDGEILIGDIVHLMEILGAYQILVGDDTFDGGDEKLVGEPHLKFFEVTFEIGRGGDEDQSLTAAYNLVDV